MTQQLLNTYYGANQDLDVLIDKIKHSINQDVNTLVTHFEMTDDIQEHLQDQLNTHIHIFDTVDDYQTAYGIDSPWTRPKSIIYLESAHCLFQNKLHLDLTNQPSVAIMTAGTADQPVADEAALTVLLQGFNVTFGADAGINNLAKTQSTLNDLEQNANVIIAAQGFEGMLPCVVASLSNLPIISVPTDTGYGVSKDGTVALNTSLSACTSGITTVNINNGFGAGQFAVRICQQIKQFSKNH